jgi:hypothetical protein
MLSRAAGGAALFKSDKTSLIVTADRASNRMRIQTLLLSQIVPVTGRAAEALGTTSDEDTRHQSLFQTPAAIDIALRPILSQLNNGHS